LNQHGAVPKFIVEPTNATASAGDASVVFNCIMENMDNTLEWRLQSTEQLLYDKDAGILDEKYAISGDSSIGQYNLVIYNIEPRDEDGYTCIANGYAKVTGYITVSGKYHNIYSTICQ
jgi:hypothetical protein